MVTLICSNENQKSFPAEKIVFYVEKIVNNLGEDLKKLKLKMIFLSQHCP